MWVRSLGREDPLEKGNATYSSMLAWRIPWTEEPGGLQSMGSQRVRHDLVTKQRGQCSPCRRAWAGGASPNHDFAPSSSVNSDSKMEIRATTWCCED